jgi:protein-tyrosine phosphatase
MENDLNNILELLSSEKEVVKQLHSANICEVCGNTIYSQHNHSSAHMTFIIKHLYLGDRNNAHNLNELKYFEIKTVINVAHEIPNMYKDKDKDKFKYIKYNWDDIPDFNILVDLDDIVDKIHTSIMNKENVFIHCMLGISRSSTVVIGYLMKYNKMNYEDAYKHVKSLRSFINPNHGFITQLKKYKI